jgi:hypothetical protein
LFTVRASCWLWIQVARWTISLGDGLRVTSSDSKKKREIACARLTGEKVIAVTVEPNSGKTHFAFDLGGSLEVRRFRESEETLWTLYKSDDHCLSIRADGHFSHTRATDASEDWQAIGE